jgi:uncharacterized protein (DUF427 family)
VALTYAAGPLGPQPSGSFNADLRSDGLLYVERSPRWIRGRLGGETVVDSRRAHLLYEHGRLPTFWFPEEDVRVDLLAERVERRPDEPLLAGLVSVPWHELDEWLEEDERQVGHPRDPYHRIDVRRTSRRVVIAIDGQTVADTRRARVLFEAGLPSRWYIPQDDVAMDLLTPTDKNTVCAYKGTASYWSVGGEDDVAWTYREPLHDALEVKDHIAFFNERVDITLDGELEERPVTQWSRR